MREESPNTRILAIVGIIAVLAVVVILFVLMRNQNQEEPDVAQATTEGVAQNMLEPTTAPEAEEEPTQEPVVDTAAESEPESTATSESTAEPADAAMDMAEYVSVTEFFTVQVPAEWNSEETFPGGAIVMANSEAALQHFNAGEIASGDLVLNIGFIPYDLFQQREVVPLGIQFEATPDVFMQSLLPVFRPVEDTEMSAVELVSLSEERQAGLVQVTDEGSEGMILMFVAGEEVVAFVSAVGYPGEMDAYQELIYSLAAEVEYSGAHDVLFGALLGS